MKKVLFAAIIMSFAFIALAGEFDYALDIGAGGTYALVPDEDSVKNYSFGGEADLSASCMFNFDFLPQLYLVPTITGIYTGTAQPFNIDDERFLFSQWIDLYGAYGANYEFNDNWELHLRGTYRKDYAQQTKDETIGKGLYDFDETGLYTENINRFKYFDLEMEFTVGYKYIDRKYPNYTSLISQVTDEMGEYATTPNSASKEKDSLTHEFYTSDLIKWGESKWYTTLAFTYDFVRYNEQKVINEIGEFTGSRRMDQIGTLTLEVPYYATDKSGVTFSYELSTRMTNQNYLDTMGTTDPIDDKYIQTYYNYYQNVIGVGIDYELGFKLFGLTNSPVAAVNFDIDITQYATRLAKDASGAYKAELQNDYNYSLGVDFTQAISENWKTYLSIKYTRYRSNMDYEALGAYNYQYATATLGMGLSF